MLLTALVWLWLLAVLVRRVARLERLPWAFAWCFWQPRTLGYRRISADARYCSVRCAPKPAWVRNEVIRLKAFMPLAGCRAISLIFNRRFSGSRRMTVGKTFVSGLIRAHRYEIDVVRRRIKNRRPKPMPKNLVWALDLTGKTMVDGRTRAVLGILEHATPRRTSPGNAR